MIELSDFKIIPNSRKHAIYNLELFPNTEFLEYPWTSTGTKINLNQHQKI